MSFITYHLWFVLIICIICIIWSSFDHHLIIIWSFASFDHCKFVVSCPALKSNQGRLYTVISKPLIASHCLSLPLIASHCLSFRILTSNFDWKFFLFVNKFSLGQLYFFFVCAFQPAPKSTESEIAFNCRRQISTSKQSLKVSVHLKVGATDISLVRILETLPIFFLWKTKNIFWKLLFSGNSNKWESFDKIKL